MFKYVQFVPVIDDWIKFHNILVDASAGQKFETNKVGNNFDHFAVTSVRLKQVVEHRFFDDRNNLLLREVACSLWTQLSVKEPLQYFS